MSTQKENLELIFSMLGETSTTKIVKKKETQGFTENKYAARRGGNVAGIARKQLEQETNKKVISKDVYLHLTDEKKKELK